MAVDAVAAAKDVQELRRAKLFGCGVQRTVVAVVGAPGHGKSAIVGGTMGYGCDGATVRSTFHICDSQPSGLRLALADAPGHPDLQFDAESLLHICDGALVVVDCIEGLLSITESLLQAVQATGLRSVLVLNKLDRILQAEASFDEVIYKCLSAVTSQVQATVVAPTGERGQRSKPSKAFMDACVFASGRDGWGFTLHSFAQIYAERFRVDATKLASRLWGNSFYDAQTRRWVNRADERLVQEKKDFRTAWSGWLLRENTVEMRWQRFYYVLEKDNLSWYTQPSHYGKFDPGPRGMLTMDEYELDGTHQLLAEIQQPHTFALLPVGYREQEAANSSENHEGQQPLVLAAENEATLETLKAKWASNLEFVRRKKLRVAGELDDQLPRRAFCQFVLEPLRGVCAAALREQRPRLLARLKKLGAPELSGADLNLRNVDLMHAALRAWLPLDKAVASTVRANIQPVDLQARHRVPNSEMSYGGLVVNQVVPVPPGISLPDGGRFMALGRVFGKPLRVGAALGNPAKTLSVNVAGLWQWTGSCAQSAAKAAEEVVEGDIVLVSVDGQAVESLKTCPNVLRDCGTPYDSDDINHEHQPRPTALMWVDVFAAKGHDATSLPALVHQAVLLTSSGVVYRPIEPTGVNRRAIPGTPEDRCTGLAVGACGEVLLHLWITQFQASCAENGFEASVSEAYVPLQESVSCQGKLVLSASPDRCHWIMMSAAPISSARCAALRKAEGSVSAAARVTTDAASEPHGGVQTDAGRQLEEALAHACGSDVNTKTGHPRILLDGPGTNVLEDKRVGTTNEQAKQFASLLQGSDAVLHGVLCSLPTEGVRFTLYQYKNISESDSTNCNTLAVPAATSRDDSSTQLCLALQRAVRAACISAVPCLIEPLYDVEVVCGSEDDVVDVYYKLSQHGGAISGERQHSSSPTYFVKGFVPVARSFGVAAAICEATTRSATAQCSFRGAWQRVARPQIETETDAAAPLSAFCRYVNAERLRQGMDEKINLPSISSLTDQMSPDEASAPTGTQVESTSSPTEADRDGSSNDVEPEPDLEPEFEPEPLQDRKRTGKQINFGRPEARNVHREPEVRNWIVQAQELEDAGEYMQAMKLWRAAYKICPQLEEPTWNSNDGGKSWSQM